MPKKPKNKDQDVDRLKEQVNDLTRELLRERITRIDFQLELLTQWRQRCQQELNQLLTGEENPENLEGAHG